MASFSSKYPLAYHVFPLHVAASIARRGALLGKGDVDARPTTSRVDQALGFPSSVHLYLVRDAAVVDKLPILGAQLGPSPDPPFPHAALELNTSTLTDDEATICNWNLAVSRPGVDGVAKGGNWTRGTRPERIREVWRALRRTAPTPAKARGFFNGDKEVPTLEGEQLATHHHLLRRAPRGMPELLLEPPVALARFSRLLAFSAEDAALLGQLGWPVPIVRRPFPGYRGALVPDALRRGLTDHLGGRSSEVEFAFDRIRRRS